MSIRFSVFGVTLYCSYFAAAIILSGFHKAEADDFSIPDEVRFGQHIRPIFNQHCTGCHGGVKQAGDISFVYRDQVLPPNGWIVEPGDPEASVLVERILSRDPDTQMPPPDHGSPLSQNEIALISKWIEQGAEWEEHWAFVAPQTQVVPTVQKVEWCRQALDFFVLAELDESNILPSDEASPERWLRRVSLDLIGLPPTVADRNQFIEELRSNRESAYEAVVDRLLKSPRYGERWASVWLDQVRYADSKGLGLDGQRNIWKYRDWVIDAFNRDLPYDQFTIKQIAGDLLPDRNIEDRVATAGQRLTQTNEEGGTDDEEFRVSAVLDRVSTTWQTWQGLTFGCVQCHSHPYDPIRHEEFYQFAAFFNNTQDCDLDEDWPVMNVPVNSSDYELAGKLDAEIEQLRNSIWRKEYAVLSDDSLWQPLVNLKASSSNATKVLVERVDNHDEFFTSGTITQNADFVLEAPVPTTMQNVSAVCLTALPLDPKKALSDSEWGFVLSNAEIELVTPDAQVPRQLKTSRLIIDEPDPFIDPQETLNEKSKNGFAAYSRINHPRQVAFVLDQSAEIPDGSSIRVTLKHRYFILASFALITKRGHLAVSDSPLFSELLHDGELLNQRQELVNLEQQRAKIDSTKLPILAERGERFKRPTNVFIRGLFLTKDKQVSPGTPSSMPPLAEGSSPDRLALANWLVSDSNPLTARVAVNRVWSNLFGIGLVATEEDFGSSGETPSNQALLDFLSVKFQHEYCWSLKKLLRDIVLSSTYRQSGKVRPELVEIDPQNRLLASGPRYRMSAEMVRDQALAIAGLLSDKMHGPPVYPPIPDGAWTPFKATEKWRTPEPNDEDRYRRSIYTYLKRSLPYPMFAAFDAPSREFCTPRRLRSNTPIQSLMMLNDTTFIECAQALAERMRGVSEIPIDQIRFGFQLATCREPSDAELEQLVALQSRNSAQPKNSTLTDVATVILNLDEVITK